ncbi:cell division protein FtsZ [Rhodoblastus acidophilus]|uniref:Cell division protein FtsZ n=1 Tax=Rhodoblastus acidophilus TaxID=1074 RepID=A0A212QJI9_RHOAC|nr:cell division protein FtsZ [Rhodoblastus acidophilus]PPQ39976.1 cell division protein FtsZ [Rhodoblastus acidophilus]RAI23251.1 cell division protein FtsZ [Rhodoblastus acidophilus]SNB59377.1 cell division protein FtsZ [Rhodoblastus acidophilus]
MTLNLQAPQLRELKPRIMVCGVGGAGGNAVNNMIASGLMGVDFIVANTDAQALTSSKAERIIQMGLQVTEGLGAGSQPEIGRASAEEALEEIRDHLTGAHMCFVTAGMGGGTGTGAAPVIARTARDMGILTVGVVTKPFQFEGARRMRVADDGIEELHKAVDTLIVIPNQNLFRVANEKTTFADAFSMADQVLYSGVACITDLMVREGLINLDFADVRAIMRDMGKAMMGTGEASGDRRAILAAEAAIANPLLDEVSMKGARGLLISITGGNDLTLYEVDEAASRIRQEVDEDANIILGATFDQSLDGIIRVSVVATGIDKPLGVYDANDQRLAEAGERLRAQASAQAAARAEQAAANARGQSTAQMQMSPLEAAPMQEQAPAPSYEPAPAPAYAPAYPAPGEPQGYAPHHSDVQITRVAPQPYREPVPAPQPRRDASAQAPQVYIPPAAEQPQARRMPSIDDLPLPGQSLMRAQAAGETEPETKRRTLLERLANFGMSRAEELRAHQGAAAPQPALAPPGYAPQQQPSPVHAEYAKRPPQQRPAGAVDVHGRPLPRAEDDQLEIPAFLRRQSR